MTEFDIQFELDWEKYSIFNKAGKRGESVVLKCNCGCGFDSHPCH